MKLLYSEHAQKSLYLRTKIISDLYNCTTDAISELILDNNLFKSDAECFTIAKLLKEITNKKIAVVIEEAKKKHLYLVNKLNDIDVSFYLNYVSIDLDKKEKFDAYRIATKKQKICLSNSIFIRISLFFENNKIKRSNKKMIKMLKKDYLHIRKMKNNPGQIPGKINIKSVFKILESKK